MVEATSYLSDPLNIALKHLHSKKKKRGQKRGRSLPSGHFQLAPELVKFARQRYGSEMGIEPARVRQYPHHSASDFFGPLAKSGSGSLESDTKRAHAQDRDGSNPISPDLLLQLCRASNQFFRVQFVRRCAGPVHDVGDAKPEGKQLPLLLGPKKPVGEAGVKQHRPESISRPREVMSGPGGIETGIDAAEQQLQPGRNNVRNCS